MLRFQQATLRLRQKKRRAGRGSELSKEEKPRHYKQLFRPEWMENDDYRMWLKPTDDKSRAYCFLFVKKIL